MASSTASIQLRTYWILESWSLPTSAQSTSDRKTVALQTSTTFSLRNSAMRTVLQVTLQIRSISDVKLVLLAVQHALAAQTVPVHNVKSAPIGFYQKVAVSVLMDTTTMKSRSVLVAP